MEEGGGCLAWLATPALRSLAASGKDEPARLPPHLQAKIRDIELWYIAWNIAIPSQIKGRGGRLHLSSVGTRG